MNFLKKFSGEPVFGQEEWDFDELMGEKESFIKRGRRKRMRIEKGLGRGKTVIWGWLRW